MHVFGFGNLSKNEIMWPFYFSIRIVLSHNIHDSLGSRERGRALLVPLYYFNPFYRQVDNSCAITAGRFSLQIATD